jgi:cyclopropane fatty-acyl-phospholipid synthase-like methyltransferase
MGTLRVRHRKDEGRYYRGIPVHAAPEVHEAAKLLLKKYKKPPSTVLDLGGGSGAFALRLCDSGYKIELADLNTPSSLNFPCYKIDLNNHFDISFFNTGCYDAVAAIEVIEHLENPAVFLRSVKPLLNVDGVLIFTTPNVVDLDSRRLMLTKGEFSLFRRGTLFSTGHLTILPFWLLEEVLIKEGWRILEKRFIGKKDRKGWRKFVVPLVNILLLPFGWKIPIEAAFAPCVVFICSPVKEVEI